MVEPVESANSGPDDNRLHTRFNNGSPLVKAGRLPTPRQRLSLPAVAVEAAVALRDRDETPCGHQTSLDASACNDVLAAADDPVDVVIAGELVECGLIGAGQGDRFRGALPPRLWQRGRRRCRAT